MSGQDRLTVVENLYHRPSGDPVVELPASRFTRELETREQVYSRTTVVGENWEPLSLGWITRAGMLRICNLQGKPPTNRMFSPEEKAEESKKIIQLKYDGGHDGHSWLVLPGESFRGMPSAYPLVIRCLYGTAKYTVDALPI